MKDFVEFASGIGLGLVQAYQEDTDVFLLANAGLLLGASSPRLRGVGKALALYTVYRRADQYVTALTQMVRAAHA